MATAATHNLPRPLRPEGDWRHVFAYHPMDVEIEHAEGVFIYDKDGNRYYDVSGGPMAVNLPHNHPRMKRAITAQLESYTYTHPSVADPKRAEFCKLLSEVTQRILTTRTWPRAGRRRSRPRSSWPARPRWRSATPTSTRSSAIATPTTA